MSGNKAFGKRIRELREAKRQTDPSYSLRQFADKLDVSPTFLSKVEIGDFDPPSAEKIKKMAELLGVDADELLALAKKPNPELIGIIQESPKAFADLLRVAKSSGLTAEDIQKLTEQIRKGKKP